MGFHYPGREGFLFSVAGREWSEPVVWRGTLFSSQAEARLSFERGFLFLMAGRERSEPVI